MRIIHAIAAVAVIALGACSQAEQEKASTDAEAAATSAGEAVEGAAADVGAAASAAGEAVEGATNDAANAVAAATDDNPATSPSEPAKH
ncbi:MAG: hypothetical protein JNJ73_07635 [Hyphomonadaceae bacterium]|nr:hypothetical protein [Hyphomonadaceae bacterium]